VCKQHDHFTLAALDWLGGAWSQQVLDGRLRPVLGWLSTLWQLSEAQRALQASRQVETAGASGDTSAAGRLAAASDDHLLQLTEQMCAAVIRDEKRLTDGECFDNAKKSSSGLMGLARGTLNVREAPLQPVSYQMFIVKAAVFPMRYTTCVFAGGAWHVGRCDRGTGANCLYAARGVGGACMTRIHGACMFREQRVVKHAWLKRGALLAPSMYFTRTVAIFTHANALIEISILWSDTALQ
jgi:hypothetical protein